MRATGRRRGRIAIDDEVGIEAGRIAAGRRQILADRLGRPEVERRARDLGDPAGRHQVGPGRRVAAREQLDLVVEHGHVRAEVPVGVVHDVDDGRPVGGRRDVEMQRVVVAQRVGHGDVEPAGIALLAVGRDVAQAERRTLRGGHRLRIPYLLVEPLEAAVHVVGRPVRGQLEDLAVELEPGIRDPVADPADDRAEKGMAGQIAGEIGKAEHHVAEPAVTIGHVQLGDDAAVIRDPGAQAIPIGQAVERHRLAVGAAERLLIDHCRLPGRGSRGPVTTCARPWRS